MPDFLVLVLLIGLAVAAGVVIFLVQTQAQSTQREAFQALAARRGWSLNISEQKLGRPAVLRLTSRSGHGWTAQARRLSGDAARPAQQLTTEYEADEPSWTEGLLVIGPPLPEDQAAVLSQAQGALDSPEGQKLLSGFLGDDVAKYGAVLRQYPTKANITVLATADPRHRVDFGDIGKLIDTWKPQVSGEKGRPILILGPDGMRLRLRHGTRRADQMESFIDLALDIGRVL